MFIEIKKYGDFDIAYTECIMVSDKKYNRKSLLIEFVKKNSITPNKKIESTMFAGVEYSNDGKLRISKEGISNIQSFEYECVSDLFVKFLKKKGFKKLSTRSVRFSD